jgi:hypothetical protein
MSTTIRIYKNWKLSITIISSQNVPRKLSSLWIKWSNSDAVFWVTQFTLLKKIKPVFYKSTVGDYYIFNIDCSFRLFGYYNKLQFFSQNILLEREEELLNENRLLTFFFTDEPSLMSFKTPWLWLCNSTQKSFLSEVPNLR